MRILGIDPGLARVGYGVIDTSGGEQTMLDCGIIRTDPGRTEGERMVEIARDLRQLIRVWRPELAAVEKFFFYRSSNTIAVVQARGVVIMTLSRVWTAGGRIPADADQASAHWAWPCRQGRSPGSGDA